MTPRPRIQRRSRISPRDEPIRTAPLLHTEARNAVTRFSPNSTPFPHVRGRYSASNEIRCSYHPGLHGLLSATLDHAWRPGSKQHLLSLLPSVRCRPNISSTAWRNQRTHSRPSRRRRRSTVLHQQYHNQALRLRQNVSAPMVHSHSPTRHTPTRRLQTALSWARLHHQVVQARLRPCKAQRYRVSNRPTQTAHQHPHSVYRKHDQVPRRRSLPLSP